LNDKLRILENTRLVLKWPPTLKVTKITVYIPGTNQVVAHLEGLEAPVDEILALLKEGFVKMLKDQL
jgi:hypothetical protein